MKNIYYLIFLSLLFSACKKVQNKETGIQNITVDIDKQLLKETSAFEQFRFVNLELTSESMLRDIGKVVCHKNKIYVLSTSEPTVFIFNEVGKFERKLAKGQGPGEVVFVSDLGVYNDTLCILDGYRKIKMYDLAGNYIKDKWTSQQPYFSFAFIPEGLYLFDPNINKRSDHRLHFIANSGEEKLYLPKNKWFKDVNILTYHFMRNNYVVWPLSNTIHQIVGNGEVKPVFCIDFKGKWIELQDYKTAVKNKEFCGGSLNKYARWLKDFTPTEKGYFFGFKYDQDYFVKWQDGQVIVYSSLLKGLPKMREAAVGSIKDSLIYVYTSDDLKEYAEKHELLDRVEIKQLYELAENEDVNPILLFVSVNQN